MQNTIDQPLIAGTGTASAQGISRRVIYFFIVLVISLMLTWLLREPGFTASQLYTLFLLFFSVGLWLTEAIPGFAVALFIMAYLVYTMGNKHLNPSSESIDKYVNTFSSSVIWLLLGGFFLSSAITKTGLDERILRTTLRISGTKPRNILMAFMLATMTASMLMSNTATTAMMVAAILPLLKSLGKTGFSKALLLGISIAASTGGMGTIIGSPSNAVTAGLLEKEGANIDFLGWMIYGLPLAILLTALCYWALVKIFIKSSPPVTFSLKDAQTSGQEDSTARSGSLF